MKKRLLDFTLEVFHIQLLKQTQNPSKNRRLDCSSLIDFFEILKIINEYILLLESSQLQLSVPVIEMSMRLAF